jgi:hypothetical protein
LRSSGTSRRRCARWPTRGTACRRPAPPCRAHLRSLCTRILSCMPPC